jgi:hypothetical protein
MQLQNSYYFLCECEKCKGPDVFTTAAICLICRSHCDIKDDSCNNCAKEISSTFKQIFNEVSQFTAIHLKTMNNEACILFIQ